MFAINDPIHNRTDATALEARRRKIWCVGGVLSLVLGVTVGAVSIGCGDRNRASRWDESEKLAVRMPAFPGDSGSVTDTIQPPRLETLAPLEGDGTVVSLEKPASRSSRGIPAMHPAAAPAAADPLDLPQDIGLPQITGPELAGPEPTLAPPELSMVDLNLGRFVSAEATDPPPTDEGSDEGEGGSASDRPGRAELVPTPRGKREVKAELIPTPDGIPEVTMARASERISNPGTPDEPRAMNAVLSPEPADDAPRVALIDAATVEANAPEDFRSWPTPDVTLVVTGQQHGYIEPCGCTGLDKQKGGVARRATFMQDLRDHGWNLLPIDGGNQVRRFGRQAEIKFQRTAEALGKMDYKAVGFGPDDLRLGVGELIAVAAGDSADSTMYVSSNVVLVDPSLMPQYKVVESGGMKIGLTSVLEPESMEVKPSDEIVVDPPTESVRKALESINSENPTHRVLLYFGEEKAAAELVKAVPGFDLLVVAGGYGEPTYRPMPIEGSKTKMIVTGNKGMYVGLVGLYQDDSMRYARVPLTHEYSDAPEMRQLMSEYQNQLRDLGLEGLGLKPIAHPSGNEFVGTETCGECHKTAFDIWQGTSHAHATESLIHPGERSDVPRHFDPECLSCHVTGWNPQNYYPYVSGYLSLEKHEHLTGNGCENCHGPGKAHVAAERDGSGVDEATRDQLRLDMQLPLEKARERCMECHDLDNSPDFHEEDAFDDYWSQVEHYGKD